MALLCKRRALPCKVYKLLGLSTTEPTSAISYFLKFGPVVIQIVVACYCLDKLA